MISDTMLYFIITIILIYVFESKLVPQLLVLSMIIYNIYNAVIVAFNPIDIMMYFLTLLYCFAHIMNSFEPSKEDD